VNPHLAATASAQLGVFTARQAQDAGYSDDEVRAQVRAGRWTSLRRGVYAETDTVTVARTDSVAFHRLLAAAGVLALDPGAFISHQSAAALQTMALLESPGGVVHTIRPEGPPRHYRGLRVHELPLPARFRTFSGGLPVTTPARTVVDCAAALDFPGAVVTCESALSRQLVDENDLWDAFAVLPRRQRRRVERVLHFSSARSESPGESLTRVVFAELGLPDPEQQRDYWDDRGFIGRVDFVWVELGVIAEFDGEVKYGKGASVFEEKKREDRLRELGFEVVRVVWTDLVRDRQDLARRLAAAFDRARRRRPA
jgi:predicted transcriptional regulator of viral defense system